MSFMCDNTLNLAYLGRRGVPPQPSEAQPAVIAQLSIDSKLEPAEAYAASRPSCDSSS